MTELANFFDDCNGFAKSLKDFDDTGAFLHGDYAELLFFIHPYEECLGFVVEDSAAGRPVPVEIAGLQEAIALLEQEMIVYQLLPIRLIHSFEWIELS